MMLAALTLLPAQTFAIKILHGPYLQSVGETEATIVWTTDSMSVAWVELLPNDGIEFYAQARPRYYDTHIGIKRTDRIHAVTLKGLKPGTTYRYRIYAQEVLSHQANRVIYGNVAATVVYKKAPLAFTTLDERKASTSFVVVNDIHGKSDVMARLLGNAGYKDKDLVFFNGDMLSILDKEEKIWNGFMDEAVKLFASEKPLYYVRGNHETRGNLARQYPHYFPRKDGHIYGSRLIGDVMVVMLDCGEDKQDTHPVYAGLTDFDTYRSQEAQWLKSVVRSPEYKKAKYRVIISHFPMVMGQEWKDEKAWHGWDDAIRKFLPILNGTKVDLMVSGHTHRTHLHEAGADGNDFPVLEQGYDTAVRIKLDQGKIEYTILGVDGPHGDTIRLK